MRVIAYAYDADIHCPECARERFPANTTLIRPRSNGKELYDTGPDDENGVGYDALDREGNAVHPVFSTDELHYTHCGDCRQPLRGSL